MQREIPDHVRKFALTNVTSSAVTFHFRPENGHGWALATVNDATYELNIQSDWGNWGYRWPAGGMARVGGTADEHGRVVGGRPCTLTEFLADRDHGHCDYLADKLTSREEREQFDSYESVAALRSKLCEMRLEQGRQLIEYYSDCDPDEREDVGTDTPKRHGAMDRYAVRPKHSYRDEEWLLTKTCARGLFDALGELEGADNHDSFLTKYFEIDGYSIICDEPWHAEVLVYRPSPHYYQLLYGILPALVRACRERVAAAAPAPEAAVAP